MSHLGLLLQGGGGGGICPVRRCLVQSGHTFKKALVKGLQTCILPQIHGCVMTLNKGELGDYLELDSMPLYYTGKVKVHSHHLHWTPTKSLYMYDQ